MGKSRLTPGNTIVCADTSQGAERGGKKSAFGHQPSTIQPQPSDLKDEVTVQVLQPQDLNSYLRWKVSNQDLDKVRETL